jgi:hypothetical protein
MTQLPKLLPVVFTAVQLAILLIVPVGQVVTAFRAPVDGKTHFMTSAGNEGSRVYRQILSVETISSVKQSVSRPFKGDSLQSLGALFQRQVDNLKGLC